MGDEDGVRDYEISSGDRDAIQKRVGVDLTKDGSAMLQFIAAPGVNGTQVHYHMFAESVDVRDTWLVACAHGHCSERGMIPLPLVEVWKRAATPHQIWLLNWQMRCEVTLAQERSKADGGTSRE